MMTRSGPIRRAPSFARLVSVFCRQGSWLPGTQHPPEKGLKGISVRPRSDVHEACHNKTAAHLYYDSEPSSQPSHRTVLSQLPQAFTMEAESHRPKGQEITISALNAAIDALHLARKISNIVPVEAVFHSVSFVLTIIRVSLLLIFHRSIAD